MRFRRTTTAAVGAAMIAGAVSLGVSGTATAGAAVTGHGLRFHPEYVALHTVNNGAENRSFSVPTWTFSYTYKAVTHNELFVGAKPKTGATTTLPTYIIPIKLTYGSFSTDPTASIGGGDSAVQQTVASPMFQSSIDFVQGGIDLGATQYIDAFQRGALWSKVNLHPTYHVLLGQPTVEAVQSVTVPTADGSTSSTFGFKAILANINWFDPVAQSRLTSLSIPTNALPIFVTTETYLTGGAPNLINCCIGGYHNYNGTYAYSEFTYIAQRGQFAQDVSALSHEIGEYVDDPLVSNTSVPASCGTQGNKQRIYEVGDPLEGETNFGDYAYTVGGFTYHLQDLVLPPYFGAPTTTSVAGRDTFQGTKLSVCQKGG